ncbi:MAG: DoxX family protein [Bacteroidetes bacterium]|nr:DoxX family protein [Bacteroidota bacterium]
MKSKLLNWQSWDANLAALLLRLIFGGLFVQYGLRKILAFDEILPMFQDYLGIGSKLSCVLVIFAEFFCGLLVAIGFLTRLSVIPIFITMTVAFFIAHAKDPFDVKTLALVFWLLSAVVFVLGSGKFSVDYLLFKKQVGK